jgi:integrase
MASFTKRGDTWQAKVRRKGYPTQSATFNTKAAAERWARSIEGKVDNGTLSPVESDARRITLREAIERYEAEVTATKRGANRERGRLARWKAHDLAGRVLASIRPHDMAQARNAMAARGLGPNSIRLELAPISHLFTVARKDWGLAGLPNPVKEITKPSTVGTERDRRLVGNEEARILAAAAGLAWWLRPAIVIAIETAMRRGELVALRWDWIDFARATLRLPMTKNGDARTVPLSPAALAQLQAMPRNMDGRVLGTNADEVSHQFAAACKAAGVAGLHFHDLRHEATSRLFERGDLNVVEIASITGHKTLQMLRRYTHPRAKDIAAKLAKKNPPGKDALAG